MSSPLQYCCLLSNIEFVLFSCCFINMKMLETSGVNYIILFQQGALVANYPWDGTEDKK